MNNSIITSLCKLPILLTNWSSPAHLVGFFFPSSNFNIHCSATLCSAEHSIKLPRAHFKITLLFLLSLFFVRAFIWLIAEKWWRGSVTKSFGGCFMWCLQSAVPFSHCQLVGKMPTKPYCGNCPGFFWNKKRNSIAAPVSTVALTENLVILWRLLNSDI